MSREDWIKIRDRAANGIASVSEWMDTGNSPDARDINSAVFWDHVHAAAVRELACIPHPEEVGFHVKPYDSAMIELQRAVDFPGNAVAHVRTAIKMLQTCVVRGGDS